MPTYSIYDILFLVSEIAVFILLCLGLLLAMKLNRKRMILILIFSGFFRFLFCLYFASKLSDSYIQFFNRANPEFIWFGTGLVKWLVYYVRLFLTGNSYLATVGFFSGFGMIGQVFYLASYDHLARKATQHDLLVYGHRYWPYILIMLWPSYLLWTCGLGKDSLSFFGIAICVYCFVSYGHRSPVKLILFLFSFCLIFVIRPYLLIVFMGALFLGFVVFNNRVSYLMKVLVAIIAFVSFLLFLPVLLKVGHINAFTYLDIVNRGYINQVHQSIGTAIPVPTNNPRYLPLFLPWTMFANTFLPLFYPMHNLAAFMASIENTFLLFFVVQLIRYRKYYKQLVSYFPRLFFLFYLFLSGMGLLGLLNTNLGLAMRQKTMYTPCLLIICCLVLVSAKYVRIKSWQK